MTDRRWDDVVRFAVPPGHVFMPYGPQNIRPRPWWRRALQRAAYRIADAGEWVADRAYDFARWIA